MSKQKALDGSLRRSTKTNFMCETKVNLSHFQSCAMVRLVCLNSASSLLPEAGPRHSVWTAIEG